MPFFSKVFRSRDREGGFSKSKKHAQENGAVPMAPPKPCWEDAWARKDVEPEEIQELLRGCTHELKSRGVPHNESSTIAFTIYGTQLC